MIMSTNSEPATDSNFNIQTKEWMDKIVSDTFDELFTEITCQKNLHPSEQYDRKNPLGESSDLKIYDVINSYHALCKLCDQHFYSRSTENDINSFFQKHINTSYHKQMRMRDPPPNNTPMFTWEGRLVSGRCNVCDMSGLNSYVLDTKFTSRQLMESHFCIWDQENRQTNVKVLRKLNLLKKFCGLTISQKTYIKKVNGRDVCLLCCLNLPWSGENARYHLVSVSHYQKFFELLQKRFNFAPKDTLNGFNLETIIRWLINHKPPVLKQFTDTNEREICFECSNSNENPYSDEEDNFSYCPKSVEKLLKTEEAKFIYDGQCLLCNVPFRPDHISSEQHQMKMMSLDVGSFDATEKYVTYRRKREKRLRIIKNYRNLKLKLEEINLSPSLKNVKSAKRIISKIQILETLFVQKLQQVGLKFIATNQKNIFCHVCDQYVSEEGSLTHLRSLWHYSQEVKWGQLKACFATTKFMDPFQKINLCRQFVCLLCGVVFNLKNFISHLKNDSHLLNFIWYSNLKPSIPISSGLVVRADSSSHCTVCKEVLSTKKSLSLKIVLKKIRLHWPCPKIEEKNAESTEKSEVITETSKELIEKNQNAVQDMSTTCLTCQCKESEMKSYKMSCSENTVDFLKVEKTLENIVKIFEKKIINKAFYKSAHFISSVDNPSLTATKEIEGQPTACRETLCGSNQSLECLNLDRSSTRGDRKKEVDEKCQKIVKNEIKIQNIENNIKKRKKEKLSSQEKKTEKLTSEEVRRKEPTNTEKKKEGPTGEVKKEELTDEVRKKERISIEEKKEEPTGEEVRKEELISTEEKKEEPTGEEVRKEEPISTEEKKEERTGEEEKKEELTDKEKKHEILLIEGLPKNKRQLKTLYSKFSRFGKIHYAFFEGKTGVLAYVEPGMAEKVAKGPDIFVNNQKLCLKTSTRKTVHLKITSKVVENEEKLPLLNEYLVYLLQDPHKLMDFILNLIVQAVSASDSPVERRREELVCYTIINVVFKYFPNGRCYPFGSRLSGLMLDNSDLDVFFDCGNMYEGFKNTSLSSERKLVSKVAELLSGNPEITEISIVDRARVPIVSFLHKPTLMRCDLSFKNGLSVQNTLLIKFMLSLDWRVRPLILFLKYWTKLNGLSGPPYFSSYAIAMLVIYYLEQLEHPVLPTIEYLQNSYIGRRTTIGGWDCSINLNTLNLPKLDNKEPLPQLLIGLFEFYAGFDYSANIISPLTGKPLPREALSPSGFPNLPICYKRHILNMPLPIQNLVSSNILICIMDPFDLSHILTKSFSYRGLQMFISFCKASEKHLKNGLSSQT